MEVRGKALETIPKGVIDNFGEDGLQQWLEKISPEARELYTTKIDTKAETVDAEIETDKFFA